MPIVFKKNVGWVVVKPTKDEQEAIQEIGKMMIVQGMSGMYTNEKYKNWLQECDIKRCFNA